LNAVQETLQQLVQRRQRELGGSDGPIPTRQVWLRGGGEEEWSYETVRRVVELGHDKIGDRIADRLAIALDIPVSKILAAAGQRQRGKPFTLPARANRLSDTERRIVLQNIDAILGAYTDERPDPQPPASDREPVQADYTLAARRGPSKGKRLREEQDRDAES